VVVIEDAIWFLVWDGHNEHPSNCKKKTIPPIMIAIYAIANKYVAGIIS
jgi:hypothetical protein